MQGNAIQNKPVDIATLLSNAQVLTGNANSTNSYDCLSRGQFPECKLHVRPFVVPASQTLTVAVQQANNPSFTGATTVGQTRQFAAGSYPSQYIELDNSMVTERYSRVAYTLSGGSVTITAGLIP